MKRDQLLAVVEKAVGRAIESLIRAHPEMLQGTAAQSLEKRLIGTLGAELLAAMGHSPTTKLRAPGELYKPSQGARSAQRRSSRAAPIEPV